MQTPGSGRTRKTGVNYVPHVGMASFCCCAQVLAGLALAVGMGSHNPRVRLRW